MAHKLNPEIIVEDFYASLDKVDVEVAKQVLSHVHGAAQARIKLEEQQLEEALAVKKDWS